MSVHVFFFYFCLSTHSIVTGLPAWATTARRTSPAAAPAWIRMYALFGNDKVSFFAIHPFIFIGRFVWIFYTALVAVVSTFELCDRLSHVPFFIRHDYLPRSSPFEPSDPVEVESRAAWPRAASSFDLGSLLRHPVSVAIAEPHHAVCASLKLRCHTRCVWSMVSHFFFWKTI